ncbi:hypothetical protein [Planctomicrobium piriforme]|uniref:Uncharacterized protein n=1 Tax=Planctomicrobium piriforme TaxID=1576369 RepID=A0A1I3LCS8_9PLAN|nr:hypothetical protein [Planctomicrobium piriforme]SFI82521.1 hypothetical protein SAMN05421753_112220 [Planctomicrobium piriforme]
MPSNHHQLPEDQTLPMERSEEEYEVITSEEVDRILDGLDALIASTQSENIRMFLEEAADNIFSLVYTEDSASDDADQEEAA